MTAPVDDRSVGLGGHRWDLRYHARALRLLQMTQGSLPALVSQLTAQSMGTGLSIETQALLIWAGQITAEPKLKLGKVEAILRTMAPRARHILVTWAAVDCVNAILQIAEAEIAAALPAPSEESEDA